MAVALKPPPCRSSSTNCTLGSLDGTRMVGLLPPRNPLPAARSRLTDPAMVSLFSATGDGIPGSAPVAARRKSPTALSASGVLAQALFDGVEQGREMERFAQQG